MSDSLKLREDIFNHILDNTKQYQNYLENTNDLLQDDIDGWFQSEIRSLKIKGRWKSSLCDAYPLAIANIFNCTVSYIFQ